MRNYVGSKGGLIIKSFLFNYVPKVKRYFSLFYGKGSFENLQEFDNVNWICSEKNTELQLFSSMTAVIAYLDYKYLIEENVFTADDFLFCDPPYMFSTRLSGQKYYKHEFTENDHILFLNLIKDIPAKILITHPKNELYTSMLPGWNCVEFSYQTRNGTFTDAIYFNYASGDIELLTYDYLGKDFIDRQRIKRKNKNLIKKIKNLSFHERMMLYEKLNQLQCFVNP